MNSYTDKLKELEIRIKDMALTFNDLSEASKEITDDAFAEEACLTFIKCKMMFETLIVSNSGFKELFDAVIQGVEKKMNNKKIEHKEDANGVAS